MISIVEKNKCIHTVLSINKLPLRLVNIYFFYINEGKLPIRQLLKSLLYLRNTLSTAVRNINSH